MSFLFELYYSAPEDRAREVRAIADVETFRGRLDFREVGKSIILTFEFDEIENAETAANLLRSRNEHIEGPSSYG
jgi:hypothetical protein